MGILSRNQSDAYLNSEASFEKYVSMKYAKEFQEAENWLRKYGTPRIVDEEFAADSDVHNIWTQWLQAERWINNGFESSEGGSSDITVYWFVENKWEGEEFSQALTTETWVPCPKGTHDDPDADDDDECFICGLDGQFPIDFLGI